MDLFTIDTVGEHNLLVRGKNEDPTESTEDTEQIENIDDEDENEEDGEYEYFGIPPPTVDIFNILRSPTLYNKSLYEDNSDNENQKNDLDAFCQAMGWTNLDGVLPKKPEKKSKRHSRFEEIDLSDVHKDLAKTDVDKEMRTNTLKGIEKRREIKILREREALRERKAEAAKTKGRNWYNMPATEITDELRQDMEIIQMRSVLNPTHFYKKNDLKTLPKYFQVGTVLSSPLEKQREPGVRISKKKSLVDELLEDAEFQRYNKRKYNEVMAEKSRSGFKKAYKKMKKLKKKA